VPEVVAHVNQTHNSSPPHTNPQVNQQKPNSSQPQSTLVPPNGNIVTIDSEPKENNEASNTSNKEESKELHGDWHLVTRRKKQPSQPSSLSQKTVIHNKSNKFNVLSNLTHQPSYSPATQKLPPRPHATNIARPNKGNTDPKRCCHVDDNNNVTTIPTLPTSKTTTTPNKSNISIPSVPLQSKVTPQTVSDPKNLNSLQHKSTTRMTTNKDQNTFTWKRI
jgi:hypothetical protein